MDNFIETYPNRLDTSTCSEIIGTLDRAEKSDPSGILNGDTQFPSGELGRKDFSIFLDEINVELCGDINSCLNSCLLEYSNKYGILRDLNFRSIRIKIQRTPISGGYHTFHAENIRFEVSHRVLAWTIYLNDMPQGEGETEFLYQSLRIQPALGDVVIFPAGFTHVHRGNPPLTTQKYIATGWYCFY